MNIHPIFVHFPIALLTVYAVLELVRFNKITSQIYWFYVKASILFAGALGAFAALSTGDGAEQTIAKELRPLVEIHSTFAAISTWIFLFIGLVYIVLWINKTDWNQQLFDGRFSKIWGTLLNSATKMYESPFIIILAFLGLLSITMTGALGGAIVYGPNIDPVVSFFYHLVM
jgi:uncharacterized membrane protein